jgi:ornithine cyclodeaminase
MPAISDVRVFDIDRARAEALARDAPPLLPPSAAIAVVPDARAAIDGADVVVPVTTVTEPYITHAWLAQRSLVVNVSLDDCCPDVFERADMLVVDDWRLVAADDRRLLGRLAAAGRIVGPDDKPGDDAVRRVDGELGAYLGDTPPRPDGVVVVNPFGMGITDVALGSAVLASADRHGLGTWLPV